MTNGSLMKVESIAKCSLEHFAILLTCIKRELVLKTNLWSFLEWPFYTGFTVARHVKINGSPVSLTENSAVFRKTDLKKNHGF